MNAGIARTLSAGVAFTLVAAMTPVLLLYVIAITMPDDLLWLLLYRYDLGIFFVAMLHVLILGGPVLMWLARFDRFRALPTAIVGFFVGGTPATLGVFAADPEDGWLFYVQVFAFLGMLGAIGALAAYFAYRVIATPKRPRSRLPSI